MDDQNLEKQIAIYQQLAQQNKGIDVTSLMVNALQNQQQNKLTTKEKMRAYFVSISLAPFGLYYVVKFFFFSEKEDAKRAALVCLLLTVFTIVFFSMIMKAILSGSGTNLNQIQQIKPADIYQLYQ